MSSTPWGSDPNAPRQDGSTDGAPGTPRGSEPPSYGTYDPGSSPSYPTEPGGSASSYGEYGSGAQSPSYGGDQGNYGDRPYPAYQQQGAYGQQGAYPGYQGGAPQGKPPSRTGPVVALIIGLLMMFGGPIIGFVVGATQSLSGIVDTASDAQMVPNGGAVELPADVTRVVMSESTQSIENETQRFSGQRHADDGGDQRRRGRVRSDVLHHRVGPPHRRLLAGLRRPPRLGAVRGG